MASAKSARFVLGCPTQKLVPSWSVVASSQTHLQCVFIQALETKPQCLACGLVINDLMQLICNSCCSNLSKPSDMTVVYTYMDDTW
jgi:hypothetical protein